MNFDFSEDQIDLQASIRTVLTQECSPALARSMFDLAVLPDQPWRSACDLGWTALVIPEAYGGLGLSFIELAILLEQHGQSLAASPLPATLGQFVPAILAAGSEAQKDAFFERIIAGECRGTLGIADELGDFFTPRGAVARRSGTAWVLDGACHFVMDGGIADEIAVAARVEEGDGVGLFVVPRVAVRSESPEKSFDASRPLSTLFFDRIEIEPDRVLGTPGSSAVALERSLHWSIACLAIEMVGTAQALFESTVEYAKQREQFGQAIGAFQATQHKLSDIFVAIEKARATVYFAAMTIAEEDERRALGASLAKAAAGECQRLIAKEGIQIHGGLGYTWEQDIHLYVKRLKTDEALFGSGGAHRQRIASLLDL